MTSTAPYSIYDLDKRRLGVAPFIPPDQDAEDFPANFPLDVWSYQMMRYQKFWALYTGAWLDETIDNEETTDGEPILRYPLQINPISELCQKRNYVLWGEVPDTPGPLAPIRISPKRKRAIQSMEGEQKSKGEMDERRQLAFELEDFINEVWNENNGRSLQIEAGLIQQILGGIVFRVKYAPENIDLENQIKLEMVIPDFFMPVWDSTNPDNLLEAYIVWRVPSREAEQRFGYTYGQANTTYDPLYVEHWTRDTVKITLGGKPVAYSIDGVELDYENGKNPFGFVPFVYIPTEREGGFYGISACDKMEGMAREINARLADVGDTVQEVAHPVRWAVNVPKNPTELNIGTSRPALDMGMTPPIAKDAPQLNQLDPPKIPEGLVDFPELVKDNMRRVTFLPKVADGEDEGSQRSALTLALRMWPLTAKVRALRTNWMTGLIKMAKMIARIAILKGIGGITEKHIERMDWSVEWAPMIPRDREQLVNEVILSVQAGVLSPVTAIGLLNAVPDAEAEYRLIQEHMEFSAQQQVDMEQQKAQTKTTQIVANNDTSKM